MARLDNPDKLWKFNAADVAERARWDDYMQAYDDAITATSTEWAPWYVIPADHKHVMQAMAVSIIVDTIDSLDLAVADRVRRRRRQGQRRSARNCSKRNPTDRYAAVAATKPPIKRRVYPMLLAEFGTGQVFWSMLWFFLFFIWIWLLISCSATSSAATISSVGQGAVDDLHHRPAVPRRLVYLIARGNRCRSGR